jgi:hypothetical protein
LTVYLVLGLDAIITELPGWTSLKFVFSWLEYCCDDAPRRLCRRILGHRINDAELKVGVFHRCGISPLSCLRLYGHCMSTSIQRALMLMPADASGSTTVWLETNGWTMTAFSANNRT